MATKVETEPYEPPTFTKEVWLPPVRSDEIPEILLCNTAARTPVTLNAGVYLVEAGAASGKTLLLFEFALRARALGTPTSYVYTGEARSGIKPGEPFYDPAGIHLDIAALAKSVVRPKLCIVDSVTLAIKAFDDGTRSDATSFSQGMQITDITFVYNLNSIATEAGFALLLALNSSLIKFSEWLHGACEGHISPIVNSEGVFSVTDRGGKANRSARRATIYDIGPCALAAKALGVKTQSASGSGFTQA